MILCSISEIPTTHTEMATMTRAPIAASSWSRKCGWQVDSLNKGLPQLPSLLHFNSAAPRSKNSRFRRFSVVAMADGKSTVLVTGAGGRTGKVWNLCLVVKGFEGFV